MKLLFISGAYRAANPNGILENIMTARAAAIEVLRVTGGEWFPVTPHLNTFLMDGVCEDEIFLRGDLMLLVRCHGILVMPSAATSKGSQAEIVFANEHNIPIFGSIDDLCQPNKGGMS